VDTGQDSTNGQNGDVTVVISCFNYGRYVGEAVGSALGQEHGPPRVVVVDDGSTDRDTHDALDRLPEGVEVVRQENRGVCAARNAGLARAGTPLVLVLDADDRLRPDALRTLRPPLDADAALGFTYGSMRFFGDWEGVLRMPPYDAYRLLYRHTIGLSALMRRQLVEDTGGFDEEFAHFEDWELWVNALEHGWQGRQVDAVTVEYRKHGGSKVGEDRRRYREMYRRLRRKHAALYADAGRLAATSQLGLVGRTVHRSYWGPRPLPSRVEQWLHSVYFRARPERS
jgi:glycosyltransferase involved in cell wall biosynthesis